MNEKELKPCPFCGGVASLCAVKNCHWILCSECAAGTSVWNTAEDAIAAWNSRKAKYIESEVKHG